VFFFISDEEIMMAFFYLRQKICKYCIYNIYVCMLQKKQLHLLLTFYQIINFYHDIIVVVRNRYLCELIVKFFL
jgi:hypothetical protein